MPDILYPPSRPQSVGEVLDSTFRIFGATLLKCLPYTIVGVILGQLPTLYSAATGHPWLQAALRGQRAGPVWWLLELVAVFGVLALTNAVLLRQYAIVRGQPVATGSELATGAARVPGMLLIALLMGLAIVATMIPVTALLWTLRGFVAGGLKGGSTAYGIFGAVIVMYGLVLVCASWVVARWICSGALYLLTDRGAVESMRYSWQLTSGNFGRLTLIYGVGLALIIVFYVLAGVIGAVVASLLVRGDLAVVTAVTAAVAALLGAVITPLYSALVLAVLGDLTVRKEGTDLAQRISAPAT